MSKPLHSLEHAMLSALLLILIDENETRQNAGLRSEELASLVDTMGLEVLHTEFIPLRGETSATLIGSGKVAEIKELLEELEADVVIFDRPISPRVQRNLEEIFQSAVIDRDEVILQIFADRAQTKEAMLQVELARLQYSLPRLVRKWTNLSQQRGGVRGSRGEGETRLELDRRRIQDRIALLKKQLLNVVQQREVQRSSRLKSPNPIGAIVGYTNSGKSTLLNTLTEAGVLAEDKLFATLDPTTRLFKLPGGEEVLLSDTVGFISDLPHHLVDAFKSTLEEARYADFLIIVCDASHPDMIATYTTTVQVLEDLGVTDKPAIVVANKIDKVEDFFALSRLKSLYQPVLETSLKSGQGLETLIDAITETIHTLNPTLSYKFPNDRHDLVAYLHRSGQVANISYTEEGIIVKARLAERFASSLSSYRV
ncbi:MAG TPA: GTPase HflX [Sphaerochaeta sp.]|nr:GTPase HflX [Sphaerochaeta sp.]HPY45641.1 GTPase HflX [Sphaerochaeta sp.]HQB04850.1 GTPase HflX [Sphaerochaeta sp.]